MEQDAALLAEATDLADRVQRPGLVVGVHDRDEQGPVVDRPGQLVEVDRAVAVDRQVDNLEAALLELVAAVEHRLVLGAHGDDPPSPFVGRRDRHSLDRQVVCLGRAARPDDLARVGADRRGDLLAGLLDGVVGFASEGVLATGGVPESIAEPRKHRLQHPRVDGSRGVVVEIDRRSGHGVLVRHRGQRLAARPWQPALADRPGPTR